MARPIFAQGFITSASTPLLTALIHQTFALAQPTPTLEHCKILYRQGWQQYEVGQAEAALGIFQQLLLSAQRLDSIPFMQAALQATQSIWKQKTPAASAPELDSKSNSPSEFERLLAVACEFYEQNQLQSALDGYRQALRQATCEQDALKIGISLNGLGLVYGRLQEYAQAEAYGRAAARVLAVTNTPICQAAAIHNWGLAHFHQGHDSKALACFQDALVIWQQQQDALGEAMTLTYLGRVYARNRDYLFAFSCFEAAAEIFRDVSPEVDVRAEAAALGVQIALLCEQTSHFDLAITYYLDALSLFEAIDDASEVARVLHQLGRMHEWCGQVAIALHYYQLALQTAGSLHQILRLESHRS